MDGWTGNLIVPSDSDSGSAFCLRPSSLDGRAQPNISCNIATFNDVFPEVVREPKPVEWRDGSQELDYLEFFAGQHQVTKVAWENCLAAIAYEINLGGHWMDFMGVEGSKY